MTNASAAPVAERGVLVACSGRDRAPRPGPAPNPAGGRVRRLRDHGRPREGDDVPLAVPARAARAAELPDRRRGRRRLDASSTCSERARTSIVGTGETDRRGGVRPLRRPPLLRAAATSPTPATYARVAQRDRRTRRRRSSTSRSRRSCSARWSPGWPSAGLTDDRRGSSSRSRSATTSRRPARSPTSCTQHLDESQIYRIDHFLGKMGLEEILYLRFANTMLEPVWNRNYVDVRADHDGRELRRRGPRPLLRPGRCAARRRRQPPDAGASPPAAMEPPAGGDPETLKDAQVAALQGDRDGRPGRTTCAASTTATSTSPAWPPTRPPRPTPRCASRSTTGAGPASRSSSAPASTCRPRRPRCGSCSRSRRGSASAWSATARPSATSSSIKLDPTTGVRIVVDARRADATGPGADHLDMEFAAAGRRGARRPYEVLLHAALQGNSRALHPPGRRRGDLADHAAAARRAAAGAPLRSRDPGGRPRPTSWSPRHGGWQSPWVTE